MSIPYTEVVPQNADIRYDLTIVTVCRNVLPQLKRTTASVLGQKAVYPDVSIEHVIVDGASTDGTPEWLAEMKAQGKIETYISEPDRGIYDAMNKGINLARGRVLLFLNADDCLELCDLQPCVAPILSGRARVVAACTRQYSNRRTNIFRPILEAMFFSCPVCHQAYFAETSLYRELGGYQAETYPCMADRDFMYQAAVRSEFPLIVNDIVTAMPDGGFSANCDYHYCDEKIQLMYTHRDILKERSRQDALYCDVVIAALLNLCISLRRWKLTHSRDITHRLNELEELCKDMQSITARNKSKAALQFAAGPYLQTIRQKGQCTLYQWFRIRRYRTRCDIPRSNPYFVGIGEFGLSLSSTLRYYTARFLSRKSC